MLNRFFTAVTLTIGLTLFVQAKAKADEGDFFGDTLYIPAYRVAIVDEQNGTLDTAWGQVNLQLLANPNFCSQEFSCAVVQSNLASGWVAIVPKGVGAGIGLGLAGAGIIIAYRVAVGELGRLRRV
jgi:hypothetical protein